MPFCLIALLYLAGWNGRTSYCWEFLERVIFRAKSMGLDKSNPNVASNSSYDKLRDKYVLLFSDLVMLWFNAQVLYLWIKTTIYACMDCIVFDLMMYVIHAFNVEHCSLVIFTGEFLYHQIISFMLKIWRALFIDP